MRAKGDRAWEAFLVIPGKRLDHCTPVADGRSVRTDRRFSDIVQECIEEADMVARHPHWIALAHLDTCDDIL